MSTRLGRVVSRGECITGLTWDPREGSRRPNSGQARGLPDARPAYEPSPQVKPVMHSPSEAKEASAVAERLGRGTAQEPQVIPLTASMMSCRFE